MIRAAIFDMDGTLLDSNPYWDRAPGAYLATLGKKARSDLAKTIFDLTLPEAADYMRREYGLAATRQEIMDGVNAAMERFYLSKTPLKPGVAPLLDELARRGVGMMVASVTDRFLVEAALRRHGVLDRFAGVITAAEAGAGKYRPDIYLQAAARLGAAPEETLVFEDALHALRTAKAAGFRTVGVYDAGSERAQSEIAALSERYLKSFTETEGLMSLLEEEG